MTKGKQLYTVIHRDQQLCHYLTVKKLRFGHHLLAMLRD
jgi:hypothetical protein